jgi:hypothetical protein
MPEIQGWWIFIKLSMLILAAVALFVVQHYEELFSIDYNMILRRHYEDIDHKKYDQGSLMQSSQV